MTHGEDVKGEQIVVNETSLADDKVEDPSAILNYQHVAEITRGAASLTWLAGPS